METLSPSFSLSLFGFLLLCCGPSGAAIDAAANRATSTDARREPENVKSGYEPPNYPLRATREATSTTAALAVADGSRRRRRGSGVRATAGSGSSARASSSPSRSIHALSLMSDDNQNGATARPKIMPPSSFITRHRFWPSPPPPPPPPTTTTPALPTVWEPNERGASNVGWTLTGWKGRPDKAVRIKTLDARQ